MCAIDCLIYITVLYGLDCLIYAPQGEHLEGPDGSHDAVAHPVEDVHRVRARQQHLAAFENVRTTAEQKCGADSYLRLLDCCVAQL